MLMISVSSMYRNSTIVVRVIALCIVVVLCIVFAVVSLSVVSWAFISLLFV
jgi:hypothetical protein